jgi:hypothetical protein
MDPKKKRGAMDREAKHVLVGWLIIFVEKHKKKIKNGPIFLVNMKN